MILDAGLILLLLFVIFTIIAFVTRDAFIFGIAGFVSFLFGVDLGLTYLADTTANWTLAIVGFALVTFGLYLMIASVQYNLQNRPGGRK